VFIGNVEIKIEKSPTDSFQVGIIKMCNGNTRRNADTLASLIKFNISQVDSLLLADRAISINTTDKFRNQYVQLIIYVPVGHHIKVNKNMGYNHMRIMSPWHDGDWYDWNEDDDYYFKYGVEYIMKENGLYTLKGVPAGKENNWNSDDEQNDLENPNYRYVGSSKLDSLKEVKEKQIQKIQESVDSLKILKEQQIIKMKDSLRNAKEKLEQKIEKLDEKKVSPAEAYIRSEAQADNFVLHI
jgi:phage shock protein C